MEVCPGGAGTPAIAPRQHPCHRSVLVEGAPWESGEMHWAGKHRQYLFVIFLFILHFRWEKGGGVWRSRLTAGYGAPQGDLDPTGEGIRLLSQTLPFYKPNYGECR